uniref:PH01B035L11.18 protein n=1 Tax=Phyllostachys edulis TaxID=38705 RepID=L0P3U8_PHYED|nr:PH01B035L11.18 [Phyllostachys edulis]
MTWVERKELHDGGRNDDEAWRPETRGSGLRANYSNRSERGGSWVGKRDEGGLLRLFIAWRRGGESLRDSEGCGAGASGTRRSWDEAKGEGAGVKRSRYGERWVINAYVAEGKRGRIRAGAMTFVAAVTHASAGGMGKL